MAIAKIATEVNSPRRGSLRIDASSRWVSPPVDALAPLKEPSAFEYRGHRLLDSRRPRGRLLCRREVVQITPLPPRRQRLERALEARVLSKLLAQLVQNR